jgi:ribosomal protein L16/L10AE
MRFSIKQEMNKLRKRLAKNYRQIQMPYTRKKYIKKMMDVPEGLKHSVFGNSAKLDFPAKISLIAERDCQVSAQALVSVRVTVHRELRILDEKNYRLVMTAYPHHLARSHGLVGVAKAERISSGMGKGSFGFPEMRLAQIKKGHSLLEIAVEDNPISYGVALRILSVATHKLPLKWIVKLEGISQSTKDAKVSLPKRTKEKKISSGQQVADLKRELS